MGEEDRNIPLCLPVSLWSARLRFVRHTDGQGPRVSEFGVHVERRSIWDDDSQWRSIDQVISRAQPAGRYVLGYLWLFQAISQSSRVNYIELSHGALVTSFTRDAPHGDLSSDKDPPRSKDVAFLWLRYNLLAAWNAFIWKGYLFQQLLKTLCYPVFGPFIPTFSWFESYLPLCLCVILIRSCSNLLLNLVPHHHFLPMWWAALPMRCADLADLDSWQALSLDSRGTAEKAILG